ncbi:MAG: class I SAM-dependent methyltransferase [Sphingomonadaceae bacterium]|nr:class I SAM-dependent methyltransferase [Sphingomonadaceae bacterium]
MDLASLIGRIVKQGSLTITGPGGRVRRFGDGSGSDIAIRVGSHWTGLRMALRPDLAVGEAYMDGRLVMERGTIYDLLLLAGQNQSLGYGHDNRAWPVRVWRWVHRHLSQWNGRVAARRNVARHYDISNALYRRFLDADMQYSCAYFADPAMTIDQAQAAKKAHIAAKLDLRPGARVLDIGCGWGGMGLTLAGDWGADVTGVTLSTAQHLLANERAREAGLADHARFQLVDYRDVTGSFDRIVSVGMFEHVGVPNYQNYFDAIARLLEEDGVAVVHAIGRHGEPAVTNAWLAKYIFPGGYIPALSEVIPRIERAGLWITDMEILRLHYAETLRRWRARFVAQQEAILAEYDERFFRMFEFYLAGAEVAFREGGLMVFQLQLAKRIDALPITRDYMAEAERSRSGGAGALRLAAE